MCSRVERLSVFVERRWWYQAQQAVTLGHLRGEHMSGPLGYALNSKPKATISNEV